MMQSCLGGMPEKSGPVEVDDIRKDLLSEFTERQPKESDVLSQVENLQVYLRVRPNTVTESNNGESQVLFFSFFVLLCYEILVHLFGDSYIYFNS